MSCSVGDVVLPGNKLFGLNVSESSGKTVLGPGLKLDGEEILVTKSGILKYRDPNYYWIDSHQKRYVPIRGDHVIGIITNKLGDTFRVDIGASESATLSYLAFEGATKRNRPDVKVGDLVFAKLLVANKDIEPELVCIDGAGRSSGMGVIRNQGFMFQSSLNLVRKALSKESNMLKLIGSALHYEAAIGMNGRIWIKGRSIQETIAIANAIEAAEHMTDTEVKRMVNKLTDILAGF